MWKSRSSNGKTSQEAALFFIDDAALKRYVRSAWSGEAEPDARGRDGVLFYVSFLPSSFFFFFFFLFLFLSFPLPFLDPMNM